MGVMIPQTIFETLPMGEYPAVIAGVEETEGQYGRQLCFTFVLEGGEHDGHKLKGWASAVFGRKSKLYSWARAAFGAEIPADYTLDTDHLVGRRVRLGVIVRLKAETGEEFNRIDSVLPAKRPAAVVEGPAAPAPSPAPPFVDEDDDVPF